MAYAETSAAPSTLQLTTRSGLPALPALLAARNDGNETRLRNNSRPRGLPLARASSAVAAGVPQPAARAHGDNARQTFSSAPLSAARRSPRQEASEMARAPAATRRRSHVWRALL